MNDSGGETVQGDLLCRACGFNLRGLPVWSDCPGCGLAIEDSLGDGLLGYAEPGWVRGLASGMSWMMASLVVAVAMGLGLVAVISGQGGGSGGVPVWAGLIGLLPSLIYVIGVWRLTEPEPVDGFSEQEDPKSRGVARLMAVASFVASALAEVGTLLGSLFVWLTTAGELVGGLTGLIAFVALFVYAGCLALRLPDEALAKTTKTVMWGFTISLGLVVLLDVMMGQGGSGGGGGGSGAGGAAMGWGLGMCVFGIGLLVFAVWTLVLLVRYRRAFRAAADQAEREQRARDGLVSG